MLTLGICTTNFRIKLFPDFQSTSTDGEPEVTLLDTMKECKRRIGACYVNFSVHDYGEAAGSLHFITYPANWINHYTTRFYSDIDPLLSLDFRTVSAVDWSDLFTGKACERMLAAFSDHSLGNNGVTICEHLQKKQYGVVSMTFQAQEHAWARMKGAIMEQASTEARCVMRCYQRVFNQQELPEKLLTGREIECLYWVANGKTDSEIATMLNLGRWTITSTMQSVKAKLGTTSRAAAAAIAVDSRIITLRRQA